MGEFVFKNIWVNLAGLDVGGSSNDATATFTQDLLERVAFRQVAGGDVFKGRLVGAQSGGLAVAGYWSLGDIDNALRGTLAVESGLCVFGVTPAAGELAVLMMGATGEYKGGGAVGTIAPFTVAVAPGSAGVIAQGTILEYGALSSSGSGTSRQLGAVASGQSLYIGVGAAAVSGTSPTADLVLQRSSLGDFTDAVTVATLSQITAAGQIRTATVAGPITDTHFRFTRTIGGSGSPSVTVRAVVAIR